MKPNENKLAVKAKIRAAVVWLDCPACGEDGIVNPVNGSYLIPLSEYSRLDTSYRCNSCGQLLVVPELPKWAKNS